MLILSPGGPGSTTAATGASATGATSSACVHFHPCDVASFDSSLLVLVRLAPPRPLLHPARAQAVHLPTLHGLVPLVLLAPPLLPFSSNATRGTCQYSPQKADTGLDFPNQTLVGFSLTFRFILHCTNHCHEASGEINIDHWSSARHTASDLAVFSIFFSLNSWFNNDFNWNPHSNVRFLTNREPIIFIGGVIPIGVDCGFLFRISVKFRLHITGTTSE